MADVPEVLARLAPVHPVDFTEFGAVEITPLSRIQQLTGTLLGRNWVTIPHVTHHDEVEVDAVELRRKQWNADGKSPDKLTLLPLLVRALAQALREFPHFNASLSEDGQNLILKQFFNIGFAIDTPKGLLVPVLRNVDQKMVAELAAEISAISEKAKTRGLSMAEMSGSCCCITSLGHIGGTAFTPIINAPDVAILGVTRIREQAFRAANGGTDWRQLLPLSLSYDHRVINGADAARFVRLVGERLGDPGLFE